MRGRGWRLDSRFGVVRAEAKCIGTHGPCDVLEALLAKVSKLDGDLAANLIVSRRRNTNTTGFGNALKSRRDVDAVPKDVLALDQDVPKIDPDPKQHALVLRDPFVPLGHDLLSGRRALDRI